MVQQLPGVDGYSAVSVHMDSNSSTDISDVDYRQGMRTLRARYGL